MKAPDIQYECPLTLEEALGRLASEDVEYQPLAGGQSLMPMMHLRLAYPEVLLDLNSAMVRYTALLKSTTIRDRVPLFSQALPHIAHQAIRNRGTIGGSVALADPAAEMPALLMALNATIVVESSTGSRSIAADDFFLGIYETALQQDELVHTIKVPIATQSQKFGFYELARRHGDYAMAGVAISAESVEPYSNLRIVFFSIGDCAQRATGAENELNGKSCTDAAALQQAQQALSTLTYFEDMNGTAETKAHLARVVLQRALQSMTVEQS